MGKTSLQVVSIMQSMKMDKEKPRKSEDVKHVAFVTGKIKEATKPTNYNKLKPPYL